MIKHDFHANKEVSMATKEKAVTDGRTQSGEASEPTKGEPRETGTLGKKRKINLDRVKVKASQQSVVGVVTEYTVIQVRKPRQDEFFRVVPGEEYSMNVNIVEMKSDNEWYLVDEDILPEIQFEPQLKVMQLYVCVTQNSTPFLYLIPLPDSEGKINAWHKSGHISMEEAKSFWIRRQADHSNQSYLVTKAINGQLLDPRWPTEPLDDLIEKGFDHLYIDRIDHPVLRRLRGEVL